MRLKISGALFRRRRCGKPAGNPLTHICAPKSDFKRQLAASKKAAAKSGAKPKHLYQSCRDADCERVACEAFREGRAEGYRDGYDEGHETGVHGRPRGRVRRRRGIQRRELT